MNDNQNVLTHAGWLRASLVWSAMACVAVIGCEADDEPSVETENDAATSTNPPDAGTSGAPDTGVPTLLVDTGVPVEIDGGETSELDGGDIPDADIDGAMPTDNDAAMMMGPDGGTIVDVPLPNDGELMSICYSSADCNGDDLVCYRPDSPRPGFCTDDCGADSDCSPLGGMASTCSPSTGQCRVDCSGMEGQGDGPCPANMVCRNVSTLPLVTTYVCTYAPESGSRTSGAYERCDRTHGDGDCESGLACITPGGLISGGSTAGYCAPTCAEAMECAVPMGTTSTPLCELNVCTLDCSVAGGTCPDGMNCQDVNDGLGVAYRCRFVPAP